MMPPEINSWAFWDVGVLNPANFSTPGPQAPSFPGFEASNTGIEVVDAQANNEVIIPPLNLNTNSLTITAWINPHRPGGHRSAGFVHEPKRALTQPVLASVAQRERFRDGRVGLHLEHEQRGNV